MSTIAAVQPSSVEYKWQPAHFATQIAPWWHTALLAGLFLAMAAGGAFFQRRAHAQPSLLSEHPRVWPLYLSLIAMEWGLFYFVWKGGLRRTGTTIRSVIGGSWARLRDVVTDLGFAAALWCIWALFERGWDRWLGPEHAASIHPLLPQSALEIALWVGVSISAGFCEEFAFRGYFLRQFQAGSRRSWIAVILQAQLFGIAHGYQGAEACVKIVIFGLLYGSVAVWRKNLRPGMMAHAATDILGGVFGV